MLASTNVTLASFDAKCGTVANYNCRGAFQAAFAALSSAGGGTLQIPATTLFVDFPDVSNDQTWGLPLTQNKLLVVPPNTAIVGQTQWDGSPGTTIKWSISSIPIFIFNKSDHSSISNIHAVFLGKRPTYYPYGDIYLLQALGYTPTYPHWNQMSGSNSELSAFIYEFDSNNCAYDNLFVESAIKDNAHTINLAINLKGNGVVTANGGGLSDLSSGNSVTNLNIRDSQGGMLISGQSYLNVNGVTSDWRGSLAGTAPGHLIYVTTQMVWHVQGTREVVNSSNILLENITEGPNTYSNAVAGGTLAVKGVNGGVINNVNSRHPEGLIQTIYASQNVLFSNMTWTSDYDLCGKVPTNCGTPTIYSTASAAPFLPIKNLTFQNVTLGSSITPRLVILMGDNIQIHGMSIQVPPTFLANQAQSNGVLSIKGSNGGSITDYSYTPVLSSYDSKQPYNKPFVGWGLCTNVSANITVNWPSNLPMPGPHSQILSVGYQNSSPNANNTAIETVLSN